MSGKHLGLLFAILSPVFSGVATAFQGDAIRSLGALYVASLAAIFAGALVLLYLYVKDQLPSLGSLRTNARELTLLLLLRNIAAMILLSYAFRYTSSIHVMFFTKVEAYFVLLWFWLLQGGTVYFRHVILLGIHLYGAWYLSTGGIFVVSFQQVGDLLIVLAMAFTSLGYPLAARLSDRLGGLATNAVTLLIGGIVLFPFAVLIEAPPVWSPNALRSLLLYLVLFNVFSISFWFFALQSVPTWIVSGLRAVSPLAGAPVAYFLFNESLSRGQWLGAIVVLGTSTLMAREHLREQLKPISSLQNE